MLGIYLTKRKIQESQGSFFFCFLNTDSQVQVNLEWMENISFKEK